MLQQINQIYLFSFEEHLFHESITVRGLGTKADEVIVQSEDGEGYFIFCDSENIFFENLRLEGRRNFEVRFLFIAHQYFCNLNIYVCTGNKSLDI